MAAGIGGTDRLIGGKIEGPGQRTVGDDRVGGTGADKSYRC
jgi:hypothetical protein